MSEVRGFLSSIINPKLVCPGRILRMLLSISRTFGIRYDATPNIQLTLLRTTCRLVKTNEVSMFKPIRDIVRMGLKFLREVNIKYRKFTIWEWKQRFGWIKMAVCLTKLTFETSTDVYPPTETSYCLSSRGPREWSSAPRMVHPGTFCKQMPCHRVPLGSRINNNPQ